MVPRSKEFPHSQRALTESQVPFLPPPPRPSGPDPALDFSSAPAPIGRRFLNLCLHAPLSPRSLPDILHLR